MNNRGHLSFCGSSLSEPLLIKPSVASSPHVVRDRHAEPVCVTSTPSRKPRTPAPQPQFDGSSPDHGKTGTAASESVDGDWKQQMQEKILAGCTTQPFPANLISCHASTQTSQSVTDSDTQTDLQLAQQTPASTAPVHNSSSGPVPATQAAPDTTLKDCFLELTKERRYHYSAIRSKLEHMVTALSQRPELADVTNLTQGLDARRQRIHKERLQEPNPRLPVDSMGTGTWPRARCAH